MHGDGGVIIFPGAAPWPKTELTRRNLEIEAQFSRFQEVLGALREIRSRQGIAPKQEIDFYVDCDQKTAQLLAPMEPYFASMAKAHSVGWGASGNPPATHAKVVLPGMEVFVDLKDLIDVHAEITRNEQQEQKLTGMVQGKEKKLANDNFLQRAPADVVQRERDTLAELKAQLKSVESTLLALRRDR